MQSQLAQLTRMQIISIDYSHAQPLQHFLWVLHATLLNLHCTTTMHQDKQQAAVQQATLKKQMTPVHEIKVFLPVKLTCTLLAGLGRAKPFERRLSCVWVPVCVLARCSCLWPVRLALFAHVLQHDGFGGLERIDCSLQT